MVTSRDVHSTKMKNHGCAGTYIYKLCGRVFYVDWMGYTSRYWDITEPRNTKSQVGESKTLKEAENLIADWLNKVGCEPREIINSDIPF